MKLHKYSFVLLLLLPPLIIAGLAVLLVFIPLPAPLPGPASQARNLPAAILSGILGLVWVAALSIYVINSFLSGGRILDPTLKAKGFIASNFQVFGSQYQGKLEGRTVDIQFIPGRMMQNSLLNIHIQTNNTQLMAIGLKKPLLDCHDCEKVEPSPSNPGNLQVYAKDLKWAQNFLRESSNSALLNRLMDLSDGSGNREIYLQSGKIWLHVHPNSNFNHAVLEGWLQALLELVKATEKMH
jgi:hypothetical protein